MGARIAQLIEAWITFLKNAGSSLTASRVFFLVRAFSKLLTPYY